MVLMILSYQNGPIMLRLKLMKESLVSKIMFMEISIQSASRLQMKNYAIHTLVTIL